MSTIWRYNRDQPQTERLLSTGLLLPKARTLRLQNICPDLIGVDILRALKTPQLVELDIGFGYGLGHLDMQFSRAVLSFVERSKCDTTLRLFHLRNAYMAAQALAATLIGLHFLTHLTLDCIVMQDSKASFTATFGLLKNGRQLRLPNLEALELLDLRPEFSMYSLIDFLESRRPYRTENGQPVFKNPQDTFKRLRVTYQTTKKQEERLGRSKEVEVLRRWGGVDVNPVLYVDFKFVFIHPRPLNIHA